MIKFANFIQLVLGFYLLCSAILMIFFVNDKPSLELMLVYRVSDNSIDEFDKNDTNLKRFNILTEIVSCFQGMLFLIGFGFGYSL